MSILRVAPLQMTAHGADQPANLEQGEAFCHRPRDERRHRHRLGRDTATPRHRGNAVGVACRLQFLTLVPSVWTERGTSLPRGRRSTR
jgi:hypothetical protein